MSKPAFSVADLQSGSKQLNTVPQEKSSSKSIAAEEELDAAAVAALEEIYERHNGDIDMIFEELKSNPTKARKAHNRPKNSKEFAEKYLRGFYTILEEEGTEEETKADSKSHK